MTRCCVDVVIMVGLTIKVMTCVQRLPWLVSTFDDDRPRSETADIGPGSLIMNTFLELCGDE